MLFFLYIKKIGVFFSLLFYFLFSHPLTLNYRQCFTSAIPDSLDSTLESPLSTADAMRDIQIYGKIITTFFSCELTKQLVLLNVKTKEREIKKKPKTLFYRTIENPHGNRSLTVDFALNWVDQLNHNPPPNPSSSLMVRF
jgi:hypothetical protein